MNAWSTIRIEHVRKNSAGNIYMLRLTINEELNFEVENSNPQEFSNVAVHSADSWHPTANALMKNLKISTKPEY